MSVINPSDSNVSSSNASSAGTKKGLKCDCCGSTDIDVDPSRADAVCTDCGTVLESSIIVSDIQFEENAHGGASAIGHFVSADVKGGGFSGSSMGGIGGYGGNRGTSGMGSHLQSAGLGRESREITLRNARKKIEALAHQLSLRRDRIEMAFHFFKLALARHLTRGRKSTHVIAACVYITCRTEGTSHMLIDFSDVLQIDVYELGRTYLRLSQALHINIPAMDPCLYVMRFAHKLEFIDKNKIDKTHEVSMTALRLVSRMKKDWMHFGRRPSGLCGAALLIAARLHAFNRSVYDVIKVVKVHESTLRKRLNEFGETPASQLTLDEFTNVDLDAMTEEQDPPSFKAARRRDRERLLQLEAEGTDLDLELSELESKIEDELEKMRAKLGGRYAKYAKVSSSSQFDNIKSNMHQSENVTGSKSNPKHERTNSADEETEEKDAEAFIAEQTLSSISAFVGEVNSNDDENIKTTKEQDKLLMPPPRELTSSNSPLPIGLGLKDTIQEYLTPAASQTIQNVDTYSGKVEKKFDVKNFARYSEPDSLEEEGEELDLTGIDDDEIEGYLMSPEEIEYKTKMWLKVNEEYLKEKAEKEERERKEAEEAEKDGKDIKKRILAGQGKKPRAPKKSSGSNATAIEAIEKIVQEKKISTKINYDVLRSLSGPSVMNTNKSEDSKDPYKEETDVPGIFGESPVMSPNSRVSSLAAASKLRKHSLSETDRKELNSITNKNSSPAKRKLDSLGDNSTKPTHISTSNSDSKIQKLSDNDEHSSDKEDSREVIVETGPVDSNSISYENDELDEFEEDDDEDVPQSAAELLSKHRGDDAAEISDYEEEYY